MNPKLKTLLGSPFDLKSPCPTCIGPIQTPPSRKTKSVEPVFEDVLGVTEVEGA
jgi:hypothetical protein